MVRHGKDIERILKDELGIFEKLYSLEEQKTGAILEHKGKLLERISREQEGLLSKIQALESDRQKKMEACETAGHIKKENVTLRTFAESLGGAARDALTETGKRLGGLISRLNSLLETNAILITDNMEYYNILLTGLRANGTNDAGYSPDGREEDIPKQSVLFNQTA
jgi:flagellar biosynthesis/type III secretory pathway chaperone